MAGDDEENLIQAVSRLVCKKFQVSAEMKKIHEQRGRQICQRSAPRFEKIAEKDELGDENI